jgi:hypothetical protein
MCIPHTHTHSVTVICNSFNPIFVLPVPESALAPITSFRSSTPITHTPGRRTGTGSANIQSASKVATHRIPITGFREMSLFSILCSTGRVPPFDAWTSGLAPRPLESIRKQADRPLVVFPECTTSNGRGLLRFAEVFHQNIPVKDYQVFVMCVRYVPRCSWFKFTT